MRLGALCTLDGAPRFGFGFRDVQIDTLDVSIIYGCFFGS